MKRAAYVIIAFIMLTGFGCSTFKDNQLIEQIGTQYAVMKVVEAGKDSEDYKIRAQRIVDIASEAKSFWDNDQVSLNILQEVVQSRVSKLNLAPSDQFLANALIQTVVSELQKRVQAGSIPEDYRYPVSTVLGWVVDAAAAYTK